MALEEQIEAIQPALQGDQALPDHSLHLGTDLTSGKFPVNLDVHTEQSHSSPP